LKPDIIHVRVNQEEKAKIKQKALSLNCTMSEYMRNAALQEQPKMSQQQYCQKVYPQLCSVANLIKQIEDPSLQEKFKQWRRETWQSIK